MLIPKSNLIFTDTRNFMGSMGQSKNTGRQKMASESEVPLVGLFERIANVVEDVSLRRDRQGRGQVAQPPGRKGDPEGGPVDRKSEMKTAAHLIAYSFSRKPASRARARILLLNSPLPVK